jgi:hypothetical protein
VVDGAPDRRHPHVVGIYLLRVTPTEINPAEPFQVDFKILNTGTAPIELPVSPHLSDLQPNDESVAFSYFSLALVVRGEGETQRPDVPCMGFVELYGSPDHPESMMVLRPGEWIRVSQRGRAAAHVAIRAGIDAVSRRFFAAKEYLPSASGRSVH